MLKLNYTRLQITIPEKNNTPIKIYGRDKPKGKAFKRYARGFHDGERNNIHDLFHSRARELKGMIDEIRPS